MENFENSNKVESWLTRIDYLGWLEKKAKYEMFLSFMKYY